MDAYQVLVLVGLYLLLFVVCMAVGVGGYYGYRYIVHPIDRVGDAVHALEKYVEKRIEKFSKRSSFPRPAA